VWRSKTMERDQFHPGCRGVLSQVSKETWTKGENKCNAVRAERARLRWCFENLEECKDGAEDDEIENQTKSKKAGGEVRGPEDKKKGGTESFATHLEAKPNCMRRHNVSDMFQLTGEKMEKGKASPSAKKFGGKSRKKGRGLNNTGKVRWEQLEKGED